MNTFVILLELKWTTLKNRFNRLRSSRIELATLIFFFSATAVGLFLFFFHSFRFFRHQEPFGPILIDETFYLLNFTLFLMLLISCSVSAYTSLFRSREIPFLMTKPVAWAEVYFLKLTEALWYSSGSMLFIVVPFMAAYGLNKNTDYTFPLVCLAFYVPLIILAGVLGTLISTLVVWILPSRRRMRIAMIAVVLGAGFFLAHIEPQVVKEQGSLAGIMTGYLPHVAFAKNPMLPSSWATRGILAISAVNTNESLNAKEGLFYFLVLLSNALFFFIPSYSAAKQLYPVSFLKSQDHGEVRKATRLRIGKAFESFFDWFKWPSKPAMAFLEKDLKIFARDASEWSQLIIFFGLLLLYFANLKNLHFHVLQGFWKNLVFTLNTIGTYIVLSSFSMRFVFPMLSMEGSRFWIICIAPIRITSLLMEKFLFGTVVSILLTLPLVFLSGWMLEIPLRKIIFTTGLGTFVCIALTGLSVGLGAKFLNIKSNNPSEIISGFGGSMLLITHLSYLALIGTFLISSKQSNWLIFLTISMISLLIGAFPLKIGANALRRMEF